jgi:hypothetical protein
MDFDPRECMFCHDGLPKIDGEPVNLAFLSHLRQNDDCADAFSVWTENMQTDFIGY